MSEERVNIRLTSSGGPQVAAAFGAVRTAAAGLGAAMRSLAAPLAAAFSVGAVIHGIREAINTADEFAKVAQRVGQTTESLSALAYAGDLSGVSMEELTVGLQKFNQWLSQTGQGARDNMQAFEEQAEIFARMPDGPAKTARAMELFGKAGAKMIPLLNGGRDGIREMAEEAERFGLIIDSKTAKESEEFNDNLTRLRRNASGLANTLARELVPELNKASKTLLAYLSQQPKLGSILDASGISALGSFAAQATVTLQGAISGAYGTLFGGGTFKQALEEGVKDARAALAAYREELEKLNSEVADGKKDQQGYAAALDDVRRRLELDFASKRTSLASIAGDPTLSRIEKRAESLRILQEQLQIVDQLQAEFDANVPKDAQLWVDESGQARVTEEWLNQQKEAVELTRQRVDLMNQMDALGPDPSSFGGQFSLAMGEIQDAWGTWAEQAAGAFKGVFGTAVDSISDGITGLILRTKTWSQALREIGSSILTAIVSSIVRMGVQWAIGFALQKTLGKVAIKSAMKDASTMAASWGAAATAASIATMGSAAGVGLASALAAMASGSVVAGGLAATPGGSFMEGGYTGRGPRDEVAGKVHRGEYVMPAPQVDRIGLPVLEALHGGASIAAVSGSGGSSQDRNFSFHFWQDELSARAHSRTEEFESRVLEIVNGNRHRLRV